MICRQRWQWLESCRKAKSMEQLKRFTVGQRTQLLHCLGCISSWCLVIARPACAFASHAWSLPITLLSRILYEIEDHGNAIKPFCWLTTYSNLFLASHDRDLSLLSWLFDCEFNRSSKNTGQNSTVAQAWIAVEYVVSDGVELSGRARFVMGLCRIFIQGPARFEFGDEKTVNWKGLRWESWIQSRIQPRDAP